MNGDGPLLSLDPSADRVSYPPVFHAVSLDPNQKPSNAQRRSTRRALLRRISPSMSRAGDQRPSYSRAMRCEGSQSTSRSFEIYCSAY